MVEDFRISSIGHQCLCNGLRRAARAVTRLYDSHLAPSGLRATQFSILAALETTGPIILGKLAERLVTERTTLTRNLSLLEARGLVQAAAGKDQRQRYVSITPEGREALNAALPYWEQAQAFLRSRLGEGRLDALLGDFSEVVDAAEVPPPSGKCPS
ncbi:MarR family winged helix-turn-helix transcriptional regulator [Nitratidesulfovibrio sp.]|uniref:MarR family winged helix-turn-helix transcriptional regulator n=1 Tax=Nitratidesulfovibrio sp. TaxID=2802297 RepID=UPI00333EE6D3